MSKVISFRLNPDNPREAQALRILEEKQTRGFSYRRVLCDALLSMGDVTSSNSFALDEFSQTLDQLNELIGRMDNVDHDGKNPRSMDPEKITLNSNFLKSVKIVAKPGFLLED